MISVVIPTWEEEKYLPATLESLANQEYDKKFEIIIVDAGSKDKTRKIAKQYTDKIYVTGRGVGRARQFGAEKAKGDIVAFTDADTIFCKDWLQQIDNSFKDKNVVGVAGKVLAYPQSKWQYRLYYWLIFYQAMVLSHLLGKTIFVGSNCAARKKSLIDIGGFDLSFKSGDDHDIGYRLGKTGKVVINRRMQVWVSPRKEEELGCVRMAAHHARNYMIRYFAGKDKYTGPYVKIR